MFFQKASVAQWEQAGLATQRKVVQVQLGASVFVGGYVRLGYWEVAASLFYNFFNIQNKIKNKIMIKNQILA